MLVYATKFNVTDEVNIEKFIALATEWVTSPYSKYDFPSFEWDGSEEFHVKSCDGNSELSFYVLVEYNTVAVRLHTIDEHSIEWDNTYSLVGQEVYAELRKYNQKLETYLTSKFHLPYFLKLLDKNKFIEYNHNSVLISGKPLSMSNDDNFQYMADIMKNGSKEDLPIVYVSRYLYDNTFEYLVDEKKLSKALLGLAYVFIEDDKTVPKKLMEYTSYNNPYNGAIQIYYPNGYTKRILPDAKQGEKSIRNSIVDGIVELNLQLKIEEKFTLTYITNEIYKIQNRNLEKRGNETEKAKLELEIAKKRIAELEDELSKSKSEAYNYKAILDSQKLANAENANSSLLQRAEITDHFRNEVFDCVFDVLKNSLNQLNDKSRQYEIINAIISQNQQTYTNSRNKKIDEFKKIISDISVTSPRFIQKLEQMGLVVDGKNHLKIKFPNGNQMVTLSSTPSDHRDSQNSVKEFKKLL